MIPRNSVDVILAANLPWYVTENIYVKSPTLKKIFSVGEGLYSTYCELATMNQFTLQKLLPEFSSALYRHYKPYDCLCFFSKFGVNNLFAQGALSFFLEQQVFFDKIDGRFWFSDNNAKISIFPDDFSEIRKAVITMQHLNKKKEEKPKFRNKIAEALARKIEQKRSEFQAIKGEDDIQSLGNVIDIVCNLSPTINRLNVLDLTIHQLLADLKKLTQIDNYRLSFLLSPYLDKKAKRPPHYYQPIKIN